MVALFTTVVMKSATALGKCLMAVGYSFTALRKVIIITKQGRIAEAPAAKTDMTSLGSRLHPTRQVSLPPARFSHLLSRVCSQDCTCALRFSQSALRQVSASVIVSFHTAFMVVGFHETSPMLE